MANELNIKNGSDKLRHILVRVTSCLTKRKERIILRQAYLAKAGIELFMQVRDDL